MAKNKELTLKNWQEVDGQLKTLCKLKTIVTQLECEQTQKITDIKSEYETKAAEAMTKIKEIEADIQAFCEANKAEFAQKRTKMLNFGRLSYRLNESLYIKNVETVIKTLKTLNLKEYLRVKEEIDRVALSRADDNTLIKIGVVRRKGDKLNIEPNYEALETV
jgi:phage host-nuclease inhibitor protein Gam